MKVPKACGLQMMGVLVNSFQQDSGCSESTPKLLGRDAVLLVSWSSRRTRTEAGWAPWFAWASESMHMYSGSPVMSLSLSLVLKLRQGFVGGIATARNHTCSNGGGSFVQHHILASSKEVLARTAN